jgi:hypothetical protein
MTDVLIAHHGYCFDGACSAALFTRFLRETQPGLGDARVEYRGLLYDPGAPPPGERLERGRLNAILDYRYSTSELLTWYFDHHVSAFQEPGSEAHFRADTTGRKHHDGAYGSCTKLLADLGRERFGWTAPDLDELVRWADIIDAARFPDVETANSFEHPAMAVSAVIQEQGDDALLGQLIPLLAAEPLEALARGPLVAPRLKPIVARHAALTERMARAGEQRGDVALFDLTEHPLDTVGKFVAYALFPTAQYSVVLSRTPRRVKLSVGFNPWSRRPRRHNIAALCERYGGGGHPVVGAVSLPPQELPRGKAILAEVVEALNAAP